METKTVILEVTAEQAEHLMVALALGAAAIKEQGHPLIADEVKAFREMVAQQTVDTVK